METQLSYSEFQVCQGQAFDMISKLDFLNHTNSAVVWERYTLVFKQASSAHVKLNITTILIMLLIAGSVLYVLGSLDNESERSCRFTHVRIASAAISTMQRWPIFTNFSILAASVY